MTKLALRGMAERKLRSILTAVAVLLGVAMISGTYVLTDGIRGAFAKINETANQGTDAVLSPEDAVQQRPLAGADDPAVARGPCTAAA